MKFIPVSILFLALLSCKFQEIFQGYKLNRPTKIYKLETQLNEVSGLSYKDSSTLTAIEDERGIIYYLNAHTGKIKHKMNFGKEGDFEGITYAVNKFYILKSNGTIKRVNSKGKVKSYSFNHNKHMDFEGICFDSANNNLLVACKENLHKGEKKELFIYQFDLDKKEYRKKPFVHIKKEKVHKNFKPSGIAIHPNGDIYVLSSFSKSLLVLNSKGKVKDKVQLDSYIFHQPEGICFSPDGTLYIANEKHKTYPTLLTFEKHEK